jgi:hypothetical protein
MSNFKKILNELSYRVSTGIPNLTNEQHLIKLWDILKEHNWSIDARVELLKRLDEQGKERLCPICEAYCKHGETSAKTGCTPESGPAAQVDTSDTPKEEPKEKDKKDDLTKQEKQQADITKEKIEISEEVIEDLDFILETKDDSRLKSGAGSNSPTVEEVKDLKTFTEKRMEQDKRRLEAEEKGEEFNEEPWVHPDIVQRDIDDKTLEKAINYLESKLPPKEFIALIKKLAKSGAVPTHLTKIPMLKKGEPGYPGMDKNSPGYKRASEIIRLYLKNDGKSPVTGKPLPLSHMEADHRVPFTTSENELVDSGQFEGLSLKAKKPADGNSLQEIMKKKVSERTEYDNKVLKALEPLQAKYDDPTKNMDLLSGPVNQFKGSLINDKLLNSIARKLAENPEEKRLKDEYTAERKRLLTEHHMNKMKNGEVPPYNEYDITNADLDETNAMMKAHNYYHPDKTELNNQINGVPRKGIEPDPDYYNKVKDYWKQRGVTLPENSEDIDFKKPPFNQNMAIYVSKGRTRGGAGRRSKGDDHKYMKDFFTENKLFGTTLEEDKNQERVVSEARKEMNKKIDKKEMELLKVQIADPNTSDRAKQNRQKKLDKLQSLYGEE